MLSIKVEIAGVSPLLMNRFGDAAMLAVESRSSSSYGGDKGTRREQAEQRLYADSQGKPVIPSANLFRCIIDGGQYFKIGKRQVTTKKESVVPAAVDMMGGVELPLKTPKPWEVDTRPVVIPSTGGRILCHRPRFDEWTLAFEVRLNISLIGAKLFREIVDAAGSRVGLGDFRPSRKGPFGKFNVVKWTQAEIAKAA